MVFLGANYNLSVARILYAQLYYMRFDVGVVCGKTLDAVGIHRLLTNPHQRLALHLLVKRHATGDHLLP